MHHVSPAAVCQLSVLSCTNPMTNLTELPESALFNEAQLCLVISAAMCWLSCSLSSFGFCPPGCSSCLPNQLCYVSSAATSEALSSKPFLQLVRLLALRHSAFNVTHKLP